MSKPLLGLWVGALWVLSLLVNPMNFTSALPSFRSSLDGAPDNSQPQALIAELSERVTTDDAADALVEFPMTRKVFFVVLDGAVRASITPRCWPNARSR